MPTRRFDYREILEILARHEIRYILIGGVCAVAHGAPMTTFDVDILYDVSNDNVDRILNALHDMQAYHREPGERRLPPDRAAIERGGPALFATAHGALYMLGLVAKRYTYDDLLPHTVNLTLRDEFSLPALDLETLIRVKRETGRTKDFTMLPILEATLAERSSGSS